MTEVCNRCLIVPDARVDIRARIPRDDGLIDSEAAQYVTDPVYLKRWAVRVLQLGGEIQVNDRTNLFAPISTWNGDPVCSVHLWHLAESEMRR